MSEQRTESSTASTLSRQQFEAYAPLVQRLSLRVASRAPSGISIAALQAAAWQGVLLALEQRAPAQAVPGAQATDAMEAYVAHRATAAMLDLILGTAPQAKAARVVSRRIATVFRDEEYPRELPEDGVARAFGATVPEYRDALLAVHRAGMARIDLLDIDREELCVEAEAPSAGSVGDMGAALELLPEEQKTLLALLYQHDCTHEEASAIMSVLVDVVILWRTEAMHRLRAALGRV